MARICPACGWPKEDHELLTADAGLLGLQVREKKVRWRVCRLRPVKKDGKDTGRKIADKKAYRKAARKRLREREKARA